MRQLATAVLALMLAAPLSAQEAAEGMAVEPSSKVQFPTELAVPGTDMTHRLTGMGVRTKTFLKVKVYAFGLYVEPDGASASLADWAGKTAKDLEKDDAFYDRILDQDFGMTLRLVMTRDVGGDDMADAFDGALRPRVQTAAADKGMTGGEQALDVFREFFNVEEMTKESEIVFSCAADGTLRTSVGGEPQEEISSPALCWALFDVYLGEKPISGDGKKKVVRGIPDLLGGM
jgi:hypothetical protein